MKVRIEQVIGNQKITLEAENTDEVQAVWQNWDMLTQERCGGNTAPAPSKEPPQETTKSDPPKKGDKTFKKKCQNRVRKDGKMDFCQKEVSQKDQEFCEEMYKVKNADGSHAHEEFVVKTESSKNYGGQKYYCADCLKAMGY